MTVFILDICIHQSLLQYALRFYPIRWLDSKF